MFPLQIFFTFLIALILSIEGWRNAIRDWMLAGVELVGLTLEQARRYAVIAIWVAAGDMMLLLPLVWLEMHEAIIGWMLVNGAIVWALLQSTRLFGRLSGLRKPVAYVFLSLTTLGIVEFAIPGVLRHGPWWIALLWSPLVIFDGFSIGTSRPLGKVGLKLVMGYCFTFLAIGIGDKISHGEVSAIFWNYQISAANKDHYPTVKVIQKTGTFKLEVSGFGPTKVERFTPTPAGTDLDTLRVGEYYPIPNSKYSGITNSLSVKTYQGINLIQISKYYGMNRMFVDENPDNWVWVPLPCIEESENPNRVTATTTPPGSTGTTVYVSSGAGEKPVAVTDTTGTSIVAENGNIYQFINHNSFPVQLRWGSNDQAMTIPANNATSPVAWVFAKGSKKQPVLVLASNVAVAGATGVFGNKLF